MRELELLFCPMVADFRSQGVGSYETKTREADNGTSGGR
jgi:hypothetical protein